MNVASANSNPTTRMAVSNMGHMGDVRGAEGVKEAGGRMLAERLSLSVGTISNVFNRPEVVAESTRQRVLAAASEIGYVPDRHASRLRSRRSRLIGVLVSSMDNPFYVEVAQQIQDQAARRGYEAVLANSGRWDVEKEAAAVRYLSSLRVEGVVLIIRAGRHRSEHIQALLARGCKVVDRHAPGQAIQGCSSICVDTQQGARQAAEHLISLGHRRLAVMLVLPRGMRIDLAQHPKLRGVHQAVKQAGLSADAVEIIPYHEESLAEASQAVVRRLREDRPLPTAVLANNDMYALAAMNAVRRVGLSVPEDVSVVGFDNIEASAFYSPPLTTVSQTHMQMGEHAVQMLLDQIEHPGKPPAMLKLEPKLVIRESTAPPRQAIGGPKGESENNIRATAEGETLHLDPQHGGLDRNPRRGPCHTFHNQGAHHVS